MIVFSRPPGWRRRGGDVGTSTLRSGSNCPPYNSGRREGAAAAEDGSSSGAEPAGGREKRPCGRPCTSLRSRRAALVMDRHYGGPRSRPKNPQGRQMCHPPMKVSTR